MSRGWLLFIAALAVGASTAVLVPRFRAQATPTTDGADAEREEETGLIAWCAEGLTAVGGGGCFAPPSDGAAGGPLILYLHGIYDRLADAPELDRQRRVAKWATASGFAVLALRGVEGGCGAEPELASKYCWPSNERTAGRGKETVDEWQPALNAATRRGATAPRYVLGFSNGGFFAALMAVRGLFDASAFAIGNAGPVEPIHALGAKPPLLLMSADDDASQPGMKLLDEELTREDWPHENYARPGTHELTDDEIQAAIAFFVRLRHEAVPSGPARSYRRATP